MPLPMPLTENDILDLIATEPERMAVLNQVAALELPDCWIGAGFVRNLVWDHLHGFDDRTPLNDVDVIYFDAANVSKVMESKIKNSLAQANPKIKWDVKNQARMHEANNDPPYVSTPDALNYWPETATAVAVRLWQAGSDRLELAAPFGIDDLVNLIVRPTPAFTGRPEQFQRRQAEKNWRAVWPRLTIHSF